MVETAGVPVFAFTAAAGEPLTDYDAVMAFEVFLGRHPESSAVIDFHKSQGFPQVMAGCLASAEFSDAVALPLRAGRPIRRGDYRGKPSDEQVEWLARFIAFSPAQLAALRGAADWAAFFEAFHHAGGVQLGGGAAAENGTEMILKRIEYIRSLLADVEAAVLALQGDARRK